MIIDGFIFYNEVDLLKIRLEELYPVVDKFVLVQAYQTFRGNEKPLYVDENDPWLAPYRDKLMIVNVGITGRDAWAREECQRNWIGTAVKAFAQPSDLVIISDVDEIPRREIVDWLPEALRFDQYVDGVQLEMDMFYYSMNLYKGKWTSLKALPVSKVDTAQQVRHRQYPTILRGGWHYSYLGDDEFISNKLRSFSHSELDTPLVHGKIADNRANMLDPYNHGEQLQRIPFSLALYPHAVIDNPGRWMKYIWH